MTTLDTIWLRPENEKYLDEDSYGLPAPKKDAPDFVKQSYDNYNRQKKAVLEREKERGSHIL